MKQITVSFTFEEYKELAKLVALGSIIVRAVDDYPDMELYEEVMLKICTNGFVQMPDSEVFQIGAGGEGVIEEPEFIVSDKLFEECEELVEEYQILEFPEYLVWKMSDRDFIEKHGSLDPDIAAKDPDLMQFVVDTQTKYRQEFMLNGVENLRVVK